MKQLPAFVLLFPAAGLWALVAAALKAGESAGWTGPLTGGLPPGWHGHEMLLGYAYAVVGGYLLTRPGTGRVLAAFAAWAAGRAVLFFPALPALVEAALGLAFPLLLFVLAGVPFARKAKKARNRVFAPLLAGLAAAEAVYQLGIAGLLPGGPAPGLLLAANGLLLLFVMGGRILAAGCSGGHQARGREVTRLAQPKLEGWGAACLGAMAIVDPIGLPGPVGGTLALLAAGICLARLKGWQGWRLLDDTGIAALNLGYLWLAVGLAVKGGAQWAGAPVFEALHVALIGALGTLTVTVMSRVVGQRVHKSDRLPLATVAAVALVSLAALARIEAWAAPVANPWLFASAGAWCLAMALFLAGLALRREAGGG